MSERDGRSGPLPWASVFDPAANARALGEIQARGLRAASELVDRLVEAVDGRRHATGDGGPAPSAGEQDLASLPATDRLVQLWGDVLRTGMEVLTGLSRPGADADEPWVDVSSGVITVVQLEAEPGGRAEVVLWLSTEEETAIEGLVLRSTDLTAPDGGIIAGEAVRFVPAAVEIRRGDPVQVAVQVDIYGDCPSGAYRGTISASGAPHLWMPVEVIVG